MTVQAKKTNLLNFGSIEITNNIAEEIKMVQKRSQNDKSPTNFTSASSISPRKCKKK
jgi:hypothetical protein